MQERVRWLGSMVLLLALGFQWMNPGGALAQSSDEEASLDRLVGDRLVLYALQYLEGDGEVLDFQLEMAEMLFNQALLFSPEDIDLWRLKADLAAARQDWDARQRALRTVLRLDPSDDGTRLDLIYLLLEGIQTLDARLARVESLLMGERAEELSRPLRSRLAVYAAAAARELGDQTKFARWLRAAAQLDPANDSAMRMMLDYAIEQGSGLATLGAVTMQLVAAAPLDRGARVELGLLFLQTGCYERAIGQLILASQLSTGPLPPEVVSSVILAQLATGDVAGASTTLDRMQVTYYAGPLDEEEQPTPGALPLSLEVLRLASLINGDEAAALASYERIARELIGQGTVESLAALGRITAMLAPAQIDRSGLLAGLQEVAPDVASLVQATIDLGEGRLEAARDRLVLITATEPMADVVLATMPGVSDERARRLFARAVSAGPEDLAAILAGMLHQARFGEVVRPSRDGERLLELMGRYPSQLWQLDTSFRSWTDVDLRVHEGGSFELLDPMPATLVVSNLTGLPMTFGGSGGAVSDVVMMSFSVSVLGRPYANLPPMIVDVDRRITLDGGRSIEIPINLRQSMLAGLTADNPFTTVFVDMSVVLDPRPTRFGGISAGPLGAVDNERGVVIRSVPPTSERLDEWIAGMGDLSTADEVLAGLRVMGCATQGLVRGLTEDEVGRAAGELIQAYLQAGPKAQTYLIMAMSSVERSNRLLRPILEDAANSDVPIVRMGYLLRHVGSAADVSLRDSLDSEDESLRRFAAAYESFLSVLERARVEAGVGAPDAEAGTGGFIGLPTPEELLAPPEEEDPFGERLEPDEQ